MSDDMFGALVVGLPFVILLSGVVIVIAGMVFKARTLDLEHRERLAMIERGLTPPPESSPTGSVTKPVPAATNRARSFGIIVIGIGFAFMCLIGIAAEAPQAAIGIGGAIVILGSAFIVRSLLVAPGPSQTRHELVPPAPPALRVPPNEPQA